MNNRLVIVGAAMFFLLLGYMIYLQTKIPKLAFVKTGLLVEKYKGMADARKELEKKMEKWQNNVDTLEMNYQKNVDHYNNNFSKLKAKERTELKLMVDRQEHAITDYVSSVERQAAEENVKLTKGVLSQLNVFIKKYSEEKGYDLVLGITNEGNILYGKEAIDITKEVIEKANKEYTGK